MVEGGGLENRFRESERGFESYLLRKRDLYEYIRRDDREAEGSGLLIRRRCNNAYRGFESLSLRFEDRFIVRP